MIFTNSPNTSLYFKKHFAGKFTQLVSALQALILGKAPHALTMNQTGLAPSWFSGIDLYSGSWKQKSYHAVK